MSYTSGPEGCSEFLIRLVCIVAVAFWLSYIAAAVDQIRHDVQVIREQVEVSDGHPR